MGAGPGQRAARDGLVTGDGPITGDPPYVGYLPWALEVGIPDASSGLQPHPQKPTGHLPQPASPKRR